MKERINGKGVIMKYILLIISFLVLAHPVHAEPSDLTDIVSKINPAVVTVLKYDVDRKVTGLGSGFFINKEGLLITNHHVLAGAFYAEVKTINSDIYPITHVIAESKTADLLKVHVDIPETSVEWLVVNDTLPLIAERIVVIGTPMGLEHTVTEGIVSAVRFIQGRGEFFQMSAPISQGSSGGPVLNMKGDVTGISTFIMYMGQNLNFAVSSREINNLTDDINLTLSEWALGESRNHPGMAEILCNKEYSFIIDGVPQSALEYYREKTGKTPDDHMTWLNLGYCYNGLDLQEEAIKTYKEAIVHNPDNDFLHFHLGRLYETINMFEDAVNAYNEVIRISPEKARAYDRVGEILTTLGRHSEAVDAFKKSLVLFPDDPEILFQLAAGYENLGEYDSAISSLKKAIGINPEYNEAYNHLGGIYTNRKNYTDAKSSYMEAIRINPNDDAAHFNLGLAYIRENNEVAAFGQYKILKSLNSDTAKNFFYRFYKPDSKIA